MAKFYIAQNTDSDEMYHTALLKAGYVETHDLGQADFIVHDAVHPGLEPYLARIASFITPHTPQSCWLWDGILGTPATLCNFVGGEMSKKIMGMYGYPHRVEVVGFSRSYVSSFRPTTGNNLLIIPSHSLQHGEYTYSDYIERAVAVLKFILKIRSAFGKITLCWGETRFGQNLMDEMKAADFQIVPTNPYNDATPLKNMLTRIEAADLVIGCGTAGAVSVAVGKPTIFMTDKGMPARSFPRDALNGHLYAHFLYFPLAIEDMTTADEVLAVRTSQNSSVEYWKQQVLGGPFNADKFILVVKEYFK